MNDHHTQNEESLEVFEELDYDILIPILDGIADLPTPTLKIKQRVNIIDNSFLNLLSSLIHSSFWVSPSHDITNRPKICLDCKSSSCDHTKNSFHKIDVDGIVEKASRSCDHKIEEDWLLENACIHCLLESCKSIDKYIEEFEDDPVVLLWDTVDLGHYAKWLQDSSFQYDWIN